jgi:hypothetical protein
VDNKGHHEILAMKQLRKNELYKQLSGFLKHKGVELTDGSYSSGLRQACTILSDTINFAQTNLEKAKDQMGGQLDRMREVIHKKTAPKPAPPPAPPPAPSAAPAAKPTRVKPPKTGKAKKAKRPKSP